MTALGSELIGLIAEDGPMSIERYMALCLGHPRHGYYMTRDPFGAAGDFTTAPEISQMFGELLGVWAASLWQQMGAPPAARLVELGPGRGTLMADALRALRSLPALRAALTVHLVEMSPALRTAQAARLEGCGVPVIWHETPGDLPDDAPLIILANEFFDALPIRQFQFQAGLWRERLVGLDAAGALVFGLSEAGVAGTVPGLSAQHGSDGREGGISPRDGDIREVCPAGLVLMSELAARLARSGGGMLAIDYGYASPRPGDSLQAVKAHRFADVLAEPGAADLTAHVDFAALAAAAAHGGGRVHPVVTQRTLLERLGIVPRASALAQAVPERAAEITAALHRLTGAGPGEMGTLFKALCVTAPSLAAPAAFDSADPLVAQLSG